MPERTMEQTAAAVMRPARTPEPAVQSSVRAPGAPSAVLAIQRAAGNQAVMRMLDARRPDHPRAGPSTAVQRISEDDELEDGVQRATAALYEPTDEAIRSAAAEGVRTPSTTLPHLDRIQASFGRHSIAHIQAHIGPEATRASRAMNALAYASGDHVVFGSTPDLRTAAHEAAHIVQQQAGVQLSGGIGRAGDPYEHHADAVADAVVAGRSVEDLLGWFTDDPSGATQSPRFLRLPNREVAGYHATQQQDQHARAALPPPMEKSPGPSHGGTRLIQRDTDEDLQEADNAYSKAIGYQSFVHPLLQKYFTEIKTTQIDKPGYASRMAEGYKAWATNYYNKTQAYLYEGQKASDFTRHPYSYAILGVDTDQNPDMDVYFATQDLSLKTEWKSQAVELKASTSGYAAVDQLVWGGLRQLYKRQKSGDSIGVEYDNLLLTVHNDDPKNPYPFTYQMVNDKYQNEIADIPETAWDNRLKDRLSDAVRNARITKPLEVRLEHNGKLYATAKFNQ